MAGGGGFTVERQQVRLDRAIKTIGIHQVLISLHPEVEVPIKINVARSADEAERQARGEDLTKREAFEPAEEPSEPEFEAARRRNRNCRPDFPLTVGSPGPSNLRLNCDYNLARRAV